LTDAASTGFIWKKRKSVMCTYLLSGYITGTDIIQTNVYTAILTAKATQKHCSLDATELSTTRVATSCVATRQLPTFMEPKGSLPRSQQLSSLRHFLHSPVTSSLFGPNILLSTLF
jgi:hypothetical protein